MFSFFKPSDDSPCNSWLTTLSQAAGWLNPFNTFRLGVNQVTAASLTLLHCIQPATATVHVADFLDIRSSPVNSLRQVKYFLTCFTARVGLQDTLKLKCNASLQDIMLLPIEMLKISATTTQSFWQQACVLTEADKFLFNNSCIFDVLNSTGVETCSINPLYDNISLGAQLFISILLTTGVVSYFVKMASRPNTINHENEMMDLVDAVRQGNLDEVNDYLRTHRPLHIPTLRYAMTIAEQTQQDGVYETLALVLSEEDDDEPTKLKVVAEDKHVAETNEVRLINIDFDLTDVPHAMRDPVTLSIMDDPVTLSTGHNVDRTTLEGIKKSGAYRCPVTNLNIDPSECGGKTNTGLKDLIEQYVLRKIKKYKPPAKADKPEDAQDTPSSPRLGL
jgi:hypothetical protein